MQGISLLQFLIRDFREVITTIENLEEQFVTLLAILAHQCAEGFHRRCLNLLETIELVHLLDGVEDIVALGHLHRREVARSFWYTRFLCHIANYLRTIV